MSFSLHDANALIEHALRRAREMDASVSVAIVDTGGRLVAFARQDDARPATRDIAITKAYPSFVMGVPPGAPVDLVQPGTSRFDLAHQKPLITFPGGHPVPDPFVGGTLRTPSPADG